YHDDEHLLDDVVGVRVLTAVRADPGAQQGRVQGDELRPRLRVGGLAEAADQGERGREQVGVRSGTFRHPSVRASPIPYTGRSPSGRARSTVPRPLAARVLLAGILALKTLEITALPRLW